MRDDVAKTNANWTSEREWCWWVLVESPVAKLASHELASAASSTSPDSELVDPAIPSPVPPVPGSFVPVAFGFESLADFRLHKDTFK